MKINSIGSSYFKNSSYNKTDKTKKHPQISFQRSIEEHKSWGCQVNPYTKGVTFKTLTYPDSKNVSVIVKKQGQEDEYKIYKLKNTGEGIFQTDKEIPSSQIQSGDSYSYIIEKGNGTTDVLKDPYSYRQNKLMGESVIYDQSLYQWKDDSWYSEDNKKRISRKADLQNGYTPLSKARIYEINIPTFTKGATFDSAKEKLSKIAALGFNAIEIMPVEACNSKGWGYDGVDKFAVLNEIGGPDGLKDFVDYCHSLNLNVIMDLVLNHQGPDGSSIRESGPYIKGDNSFGSSFNYEGENSKYVRDFAVNAALNWINNYHCDGLRFDLTKFFESDTLMQQIAAELNTHNPDAFIIAEDSRGGITVHNDEYWQNFFEPHDCRVTNPLKQSETGEGLSEEAHLSAIERIENNGVSLSRLGFDSEWDFNFYHNLKNMLYGAVDINSFEMACCNNQGRVKYVTNHDEIGNYDGTRLIAKLMTNELKLNDKVTVTSSDIARAEAYSKLKNLSYHDALNVIRSQKAQFLGEKLATLYQCGKIDEYKNDATNEKFKNEILSPNGIYVDDLDFDEVEKSFINAYNTIKLAYAITYSIPGPKLIFQGDEKMDLTPFRFFRQFSSIPYEDYLYIEKGYEPGLKAWEASRLDNINYCKEGLEAMRDFENLIADLNKLSTENSAMANGEIVYEDTIKHPLSDLIAFHLKNPVDDKEIFIICNFADKRYISHGIGQYGIKFPEGKWKEVLNTDDRRYLGNGILNNDLITSNTNNNSYINLAEKSAAIFERVE